MNYREMAARLAELGCEEKLRRSRGSHRKWFSPTTGKVAVVPDHGRKDLMIGTIRAVVRDLGLNWSEFNKRR